MGKFIDMTGQKYGRLTVISRAENATDRDGTIRTQWNCVCDCGTLITARGKDIRSGNTKSCGCMNRESIRAFNFANKTTHGGRYTRLYKIWRGMKDRCYNDKLSYYARYGGRGIMVCKDWSDDFQSFKEWALENGYADNLTLDRIDVNGNYEPSNCRWVTMKEQGNNRRTNHTLTYNGEKKTISEWAEITGLSKGAIWHRIDMGWDVEATLTKPARKSNRKKVV